MMDEVLRKRLSLSAVFVSITIAAIFFSPDWLFFAVVQAFSLLGLNEFLTMAEKKNVRVNRVLCLIFGAAVPFASAYSAETLVLAVAALVLFVMHFDKNANRDQALLCISLSLFGILYVPVLFAHLIKLRHLGYGSQLLFYTILLAKGGDAGAYFIGKKYGKAKLIEHISPNKSVEGAVGGLAVSVVLSLLSKSYLGFIPFPQLLIMGVLIGVIAQLGDLAESMIKREVGVKDSGALPGLGGVLDMLDSLIFTVPFTYYYVMYAL
jgi:phosphatidate cytidylyltransferase